ncbi:alpha-2-macroglobulin family protein [Flavitalea flava]
MTMKKFLAVSLPSLLSTLLFNSLLMAQIRPADYVAKWKAVDSLIEKKGLTQSALTEVNKIYAAAKQQNNDPQVIKALLYRMNLQAMTIEDGAKKTLDELDKESVTAKQPARAILQSILADAYWNYFQQNRWKFYNRTQTKNFVKEDIATWDAGDFQQKISALYISSLADEKLLQQTKLEFYDPIIIKGNARGLRPTLFDLLAHKALDYFKTGEREINKPAYAFELDDPMVFSEAAVFSRYLFTTKDSLSNHFVALQLFQRLIRLHLNDSKPDAFLDVDIERIVFANSFAVMDDKETLYTKALVYLTDHFGNEPVVAQAWYLQAQQYAERAGKYNPSQDTTNRYAYVKAKAICEKVFLQKDSSEGKTNCGMLLNTILHKELVLQTEKVNLPDQPFRSLITWRNFSQLYFRLIRIDRIQKEKLGNNPWEDGYWTKLLQLPSLKTFTQSLPETGDYQTHRTEIKIEALPVGSYALVACSENGFGLTKNAMAVQYFYVSGISFINQDQNYFVLNRETGQPLKTATVQVWNRSYNYKDGRTELVKAESYRTDGNGYFRLKEKAQNDRIAGQSLEISLAGDHLFTEDQISPNYYSRSEEDASGNLTSDKLTYEKNNLNTFFFTDRSIYRPGQTIYFKGIVVTRDFDSKKAKILSSFKTKVILYNANRQKVDSLELSTNDFGSYHGRFTLPDNLLNGQFQIVDDSTGNEQSFSVEEYKRPKFFVEYDKLKGSHRVGDTIRITGNAKSYSGNNIDGAAVRYRVVRQARFPYPWLFRNGRNFYPVSGQEIAHGEVKTDAQGRFVISFTALPDRNINKELDPVFEYRVTSDITDINGETRSGATTARVGYKALELSIIQPSAEHLPADSLKELTVTAANLSGEPEPASVLVSIYQLKAPDRLIRARYWEQPDQFVLGEKEYLNAFPHDEYRDETKKENWERGEKVSERLDSTGNIGITRGEFSTGMRVGGKINDKRLLPGWYVIEATTKDKYGKEVKAIKYIELYDNRTSQPVSPQYNWALGEYQTVEPGDKATVNIGSSAADLFIIRKIDRSTDGRKPIRPLFPKPRPSVTGKPGSPVKNAISQDPAGPGQENEFYYLTLSRDKKSVEFPITETDRGGFGILDVFVKDNRVYTRSNTINVPWTNKELSVSYTSFRDKTLPGSEEKWQVKIGGYKADKVTAEVLAGMYDASLDQFKMQSWQKPGLYPIYQGEQAWNGTPNFSEVRSQEKYWNEDYGQPFTLQYDVLLSPNTGGRRQYTNGGEMYVHAGKVMAPQAAMRMKGESDKVLAGAAPGLAVANDNKKELLADSASVKATDSKESTSPAQSPVQIRKNFNETALFFPDLRTDSEGNTNFSFTMPEALTTWKLMTLAHTRDLAFGYAEKSVITQKQLMVQPNIPRFLREGDRMELTTKIVNLTDSELTGQVELQLTDPTNGKTADGWFSNRQPTQFFTVGPHQSSAVGFSIEIPFQYNRPLTYRLVAKGAPAHAGGNRMETFSDGEEGVLPVVSNRMLVTESLPLNMPGKGIRKFAWDKLLKSGNSETLNNHALTVEFTSNPAWYAIQALPYLMEYPYECAEQVFNRFYANALASKIAGSSPRIQAIFEKWKTTDTAALLSNLEKNQELKSVLLEETPWVLQAKNESQQKKNIALLFDMTRMSRELESSLAKLKDLQSPNGGFVWFKGGEDNRFITQYILTGIGHLQKLNAIPSSFTEKIKMIVSAALPYTDKKIKQDYEELMKQKKTQWIGEYLVQYLYMRSFFNDYGIPGDAFAAVNYFRKQAQKSWPQTGRFMQGMAALAFFRTGDIQTAKDIMTSLRQNAIRDEEKGMYWKGMEGGYYWYQAPVETQSLLIEAFREISQDATIDRDLKTWLLKQKQTQSWPTTKATADACYALLLGGANWLSEERNVEIRLGDKTISSTSAHQEAGTGYFKQIIDGPFVKPSMGNITVTLAPGSGTGNSPTAKEKATGDLPAWGAVYWQYFENLDKITLPGNAKAPVRLVKKLFVEKNTDRGLVLEPVAENGVLHVGDKVKVRIELQTDRDLEFVHLKDMRASCMEPVNVISGYKWQGGLGYYESTKDASTNFFFSWIPRGTYIFEYPLFVGQNGNFSNGVTNIECMYAPEFASHSEGIRVNVEVNNP